MNIVLLGAPGSGKGTQASLLVDRLNARPMSTGDLFRKILGDPDHPLYPQLQVINEGKLVSDEVVNQVVESGIEEPEYQNGVIFDGYPRTIAQAEALDKMLKAKNKKLDLVFELNVTKEVLFYRILGRQVCPGCKAVYHEEQGYKTCPNCNTALIRRGDDNEETIIKRLEDYKNKTAPLKDYYKNSDTLLLSITVDDASLQAEEVNARIIKVLEENNVL